MKAWKLRQTESNVAAQTLKNNVVLIPLSEMRFIKLLLKFRYVNCPDSFNETTDEKTKVCVLIPPIRDRLHHMNLTRF